MDWIPERTSPPVLLALSGADFRTLEALTPSVSLRPRRVRAPAARQPASPKSHPNSSASFEDRILGGHRPQIGEESPFRLVGRSPLSVFGSFPLSQGRLLDGLPAVLRVGWWGGGQGGRCAQGRYVGSSRHPGRIRWRSLEFGKSWILDAFVVGNDP